MIEAARPENLCPALHLDAVTCTHARDGGAFTLDIPGLSLFPGEAVAVVGPSGAGKSTLLDLLALALPPRTARAFTIASAAREHTDVAALWQARDDDALTNLRAARIGYVLQQGGLLPFLSVAANIALPQRILGKPDPHLALALAERLGIAALLRRTPASLSVGQRQRVAIARALAHAPALVLADEPTASLHPAMADDVMKLLVEQARFQRVTLLLATHDPDRAARHGFEILHIEAHAATGGATRSTLHPRDMVRATG